ncbi:MAG: ATP-grasp domain-containing protein [bacterium]|nr:ATP-grasp domain-containing protein [bacterium]
MTKNTQLLLEELKRQGIPYELINSELNTFRYQAHDGAWHYMCGMISEYLPASSYIICKEKYLTYQMFINLDIPTPATINLNNYSDDFLNEYSPLVLKPGDSAHGRGIVMNIINKKMLMSAVKNSEVSTDNILLQQQVEGIDLRMLLIGGHLVSTVERRPANVIGDGHHNISQLIKIENERPEREYHGTSKLRQISIEACNSYLSRPELNHIPKDGVSVRVAGPANQSLGGSVHQAAHHITDEISRRAITIARHINAPIAGVDCILTPNGDCYFIEINASPGIGIHDDNFWGIKDKSYEHYARWLVSH